MMTYFFKTHMTRLRKAGGAMAIFLVALSSCGGSGNGSDRNFPGNFMSIGDAYRVAYVMEHTTPDSVARFICDAALGKVKGAKIDTLATATLHAYENYRDSNLVVFSETFDNYSNSLPLPEKMKILSMAGLNDPQGLGYEPRAGIRGKHTRATHDGGRGGQGDRGAASGLRFRHRHVHPFSDRIPHRFENRQRQGSSGFVLQQIYRL